MKKNKKLEKNTKDKKTESAILEALVKKVKTAKPKETFMDKNSEKEALEQWEKDLE
jgi:hypothetical protein